MFFELTLSQYCTQNPTALPYPNIALDWFGLLIILTIFVHKPRFMIFIPFRPCSIFIRPSLNIPRLVESQSEGGGFSTQRMLTLTAATSGDNTTGTHVRASRHKCMASRYLNDLPIEITGYILRMAIRTLASYDHHRQRAG